MRGVAAVVQDHVGLPVLGVDALVDAPPEVLLSLSAPGEHGDSWPRGESSVTELLNWTGG